MHRGVAYESTCGRRASCGTVNKGVANYVWTTRANYSYTKSAFFKIEVPGLIGKVHNAIDFLIPPVPGPRFDAHMGTYLNRLGITGGFDDFGTASCNFGQATTSTCYVKDETCPDFASCIGSNWFWLTLEFEITPTAIRKQTYSLTRCTASGDVCENVPFLIRTRPDITDPVFVAKILAARAGDNIYPDNGGSGVPRQGPAGEIIPPDPRVTLEDYVETLEGPLSLGKGMDLGSVQQTIPASLRRPRIRGPSYVTFR